LTRVEVAVLLGVSITGHTALAVQVVRGQAAGPAVVAQGVSIEVVPAAVEPPQVPPPPAPAPEPPRPRARPRLALNRPAAPRPRLQAPPPVESPPVTDEPSEAPPPVADASPADGPPGPAEVAPPPPPSPAPKPAPIVAAREGANYLRNPRPAYPELAMRREWQGDVLLRVRVSSDGRAAGITVERSSGREVLDRAAVDAVRSWTFVPARQGGLAIGGWVTVPIVFRLQQGE
jgi:protein TonB